MSRTRVWATPLTLAGLSVVGLAGALVGDGIWDALSALFLAAPLAAIVRHLCARSAAHPDQDASEAAKRSR